MQNHQDNYYEIQNKCAKIHVKFGSLALLFLKYVFKYFNIIYVWRDSEYFCSLNQSLKMNSTKAHDVCVLSAECMQQPDMDLVCTGRQACQHTYSVNTA